MTVRTLNPIEFLDPDAVANATNVMQVSKVGGDQVDEEQIEEHPLTVKPVHPSERSTASRPSASGGTEDSTDTVKTSANPAPDKDDEARSADDLPF